MIKRIANAGKSFFNIFSIISQKRLTNKGVCDIISHADREKGTLPWQNAGVAELADARDLKSRDTKVSYRFDPGHRHHHGKKFISRSRAAW